MNMAIRLSAKYTITRIACPAELKPGTFLTRRFLVSLSMVSRQSTSTQPAETLPSYLEVARKGRPNIPRGFLDLSSFTTSRRVQWKSTKTAIKPQIPAA